MRPASQLARLAMIHFDGFDQATLKRIHRVTRALARSDRELADDLAQDTALIALERRPTDPNRLGPWLVRVARNRLYTQRASDARYRRSREEREQDESVRRPEPDPAVALLRAELSDSLHEKLEALPERYRLAIELRVLEGLPPREVAVRLGIPVATVRSHVRRGLDLLRAQLGDESRWEELRRVITGLPFFGSRWWVAAGAAAAVTAVAILVLRGGTTAPDSQDAGRTARGTNDVEVAQVDGGGREAVETERAADASQALPQEESEVAAAAAVLPIDVKVVDSSGAPVPSAEIFGQRNGTDFLAHERLGVTDAEGNFQIGEGAGMRWIAARGEPGHVSDSVLVTQPSVTGDGAVRLVMDEMSLRWIEVIGAPANGGPISVHSASAILPGHVAMLPGQGIVGTTHWVPAWRDADGRHGVLWNDRPRRLLVRGEEELLWWGRRYGPGNGPKGPIDLTDAFAVTGRVVDLAGQPLGRIQVELQSEVPAMKRRLARRTWSDEEGRFCFPGANLEKSLIAVVDSPRRTIERSVAGDLDIGDFQVEPLATFVTTVETSALEGEVTVTALTLDEKRVTAPLRLLQGPATVLEGREVRPGVFEIPASSSTLANVTVTVAPPDGGPVQQRLFRRDGKQPMPSLIRCAGPLSPLATLSFEVPESVRPARAVVIERHTGASRWFDLEKGGPSTPGLTVNVPDGAWHVLCLAADGGTHRSDPIFLAPGDKEDIGDVTGPGALLVPDWSAVEAEGKPDDTVTVEVRLASEILLTRSVRRGDLSRVLDEMSFSGGWHAVRVISPGQNFIDNVYLFRGQTTRCRPELACFSLRIRMGSYSRRESVEPGQIIIRGPSGEVCFEQPLVTDIPESLQIVSVPRTGRGRHEVEVRTGDRTLTGTLDVRRFGGQLSVWVRDEAAADPTR